MRISRNKHGLERCTKKRDKICLIFDNFYFIFVLVACFCTYIMQKPNFGETNQQFWNWFKGNMRSSVPGVVKIALQICFHFEDEKLWFLAPNKMLLHWLKSVPTILRTQKWIKWQKCMVFLPQPKQNYHSSVYTIFVSKQSQKFMQ